MQTGFRRCCRAAVLILAAALLSIVSCQRRPLEELGGGTRTRIRITVRTDGIRNVTSDIYNSSVPVPELVTEAMHVVFFDESGRIAAETYLTATERDAEGNTVFVGDVNVVPGTYRIYACSFGAESTLVQGPTAWESDLAYAVDVSENVAAACADIVPQGESLTLCPDHLFVARLPQETIPAVSDIYTVCADARTVVESYYLQIKVEGLKYLSNATAVLTGLSSGNLIAQGSRVDDPLSSIRFEMKGSSDGGRGVLCAIFSTFGRPAGSANNLQVTFRLTSVDGRIDDYCFDLSDLFLSEDCINHNWLLLDETIRIDPVEVKGGGGLEPSIGEWDDENHETML